MTLLETPPMNDMIHYIAVQSGPNYRNPFTEARERAATKTTWQTAVVNDVVIDTTISCEAIDNNWKRVINRLESELDTQFVTGIMAPCPAYSGWTISVQFQSFDDYHQQIEALRTKIERICNDQRR